MQGIEFLNQVALDPLFRKVHPKVADFYRQYISHEKVILHNGQYVINSHFPPYPSGAFENLAERFNHIPSVNDRRLFSVMMAITNRCPYDCWHCYNAGRSQKDVALSDLLRVVDQIKELGALHVTLTGGEPLLRKDLEDMVAAFDDRAYLTLNTTGSGLTDERARSLREAGLYAVGISLDSVDPEEHDRKRGAKGAFQTTLDALAHYVPDIREKLDYVDCSTPLTFERYTKHVEGASFGTKFEGLAVSRGLPEQIAGLYHAGSVGIIMSGWLGAVNYGVIVSNDVDAFLMTNASQTPSEP